MASMVWFELKPFQGESENAGLENMNRMLDHLGHFIFLIYREGENVRIFVRTHAHMKATLSNLDGVEVSGTESPEFGHFPKYREMFMKRHCAYQIADKDTTLTSPYNTISNVVNGSAFLLFHAKMVRNAPQISSFIGTLSRGGNPESILSSISMGGSSGKKRPSESKLNKIRIAKQKIVSGRLFYARIIVGASNKDDLKAIIGTFPADAFVPKEVKKNKVGARLKGVPTPPMFGASKMVVLNPVEITSFLRMPSNEDITTGKFVIGKPASKGSGTARVDYDGEENQGEADDGHTDDNPDFMEGTDGNADDSQDATPNEDEKAESTDKVVDTNHTPRQPDVDDSDMSAFDEMAMEKSDETDTAPVSDTGRNDSEVRPGTQNGSEDAKSNVGNSGGVPKDDDSAKRDGSQDVNQAKVGDTRTEDPETVGTEITPIQLAPLETSILHMLFFKKTGMYKDDIINGVSKVFGTDRRTTARRLESLVRDMHVKIRYPNTEEMGDPNETQKRYVIGEAASEEYFRPYLMTRRDGDARSLMMFNVAIRNMNLHRCCIPGGDDSPDLLIMGPHVVKSKVTGDNSSAKTVETYDPDNWDEDATVAAEFVEAGADIESAIDGYGRDKNNGHNVWFLCFNGKDREDIETRIREKHHDFDMCSMDVINPRSMPETIDAVPDTYDDLFQFADVETVEGLVGMSPDIAHTEEPGDGGKADSGGGEYSAKAENSEGQVPVNEGKNDGSPDGGGDGMVDVKSKAGNAGGDVNNSDIPKDEESEGVDPFAPQGGREYVGDGGGNLTSDNAGDSGNSEKDGGGNDNVSNAGDDISEVSDAGENGPEDDVSEVSDAWKNDGGENEASGDSKVDDSAVDGENEANEVNDKSEDGGKDGENEYENEHDDDWDGGADYKYDDENEDDDDSEEDGNEEDDPEDGNQEDDKIEDGAENTEENIPEPDTPEPEDDKEMIDNIKSAIIDGIGKRHIFERNVNTIRVVLSDHYSINDCDSSQISKALDELSNDKLIVEIDMVVDGETEYRLKLPK